jgi:hypothetical protein
MLLLPETFSGVEEKGSWGIIAAIVASCLTLMLFVAYKRRGKNDPYDPRIAFNNPM